MNLEILVFRFFLNFTEYSKMSIQFHRLQTSYRRRDEYVSSSSTRKVIVLLNDILNVAHSLKHIRSIPGCPQCYFNSIFTENEIVTHIYIFYFTRKVGTVRISSNPIIYISNVSCQSPIYCEMLISTWKPHLTLMLSCKLLLVNLLNFTRKEGTA